MSDGCVCQGLINEKDIARLPADLPAKLLCTSWCMFDQLGDEYRYEVFWQWETFFDDVSDNLTNKSTCSNNSGESFRDDNDEDHDNEEEEDLGLESKESQPLHTLPFKVLGVAHSRDRQDHLQKAFNRMRKEKLPVSSTIKVEPNNPIDSSAIAVFIDYGADSCHVGYIPKELTKFIHPLIRENKIIKVEVEDINFRVAWLRAGYYIKLLITRIGQWEPYVIRASKGVR